MQSSPRQSNGRDKSNPLIPSNKDATGEPFSKDGSLIPICGKSPIEAKDTVFIRSGLNKANNQRLEFTNELKSSVGDIPRRDAPTIPANKFNVVHIHKRDNRRKKNYEKERQH